MRLSLLLLLIKKDIRALRLQLLLMWAVMAWMSFLPFDQKGATTAGILSLIAGCLSLVIYVQALQADAPDSGNFFSTKPYSVPALIAAKWLLLVLIWMIPLMAVAGIQLHRTGLGFSADDYMWKFTLLFLEVVGLSGIVAPFAVGTKSIIQFLLRLIACILVWQMLSFLATPGGLKQVFYFIMIPHTGEPGLAATRDALAWAVLGLTGYGLLYGVYQRWDRAAKVLLSLVGVGVVFLVMAYWPVSFYPAAPQEKQTAAITALQSVELGPLNPDEINDESESWREQPGGFSLTASIWVKKVPDPYYLQGEKVTSSVMLRDGRKQTCKDFYFEGTKFGSSLRNGKWETAQNAGVFLYLKQSLLGKITLGDLTGSVVKGHVDYGIYESIQVADLPLTEGAGYAVDGATVRISRIEKSHNWSLETLDVSIETLTSDHIPPLQGYLLKVNGKLDDRDNLIPGPRPYSPPAPSMSQYVSFAPAGLTWRRLTVSYYIKQNLIGSISPEDIQGARLHVFQVRRVGSLTLPFSIEP